MTATSPSHQPDPNPPRRGLHREVGPAARLAPRVPGGAGPGERGSANTRAPPSLGPAPAATAEYRGDSGTRRAVGARERRAGPARRGAGQPPSPPGRSLPPPTRGGGGGGRAPEAVPGGWASWEWHGRVPGEARGPAGPPPARARPPAPRVPALGHARRAGGAQGSSEAAAAPAGLGACAGTLLVLPPGAWRNARRRERAQPRGAGGRARWQVGHGEGRGRGEQEGRRTLAHTYV